MASSPSLSAAGDPPPEPPRGWLSGLVSSAGRLLAAVLDPDSPGSASSSSPESSQSPPPPRGADGTGDHGNAANFASDNYQLNQTGKEIVLKDYAEGSVAIVSEIDPKDAIMQLLMQETYSRSECHTLIKIIQERVADSDPGGVEPEVVLPIAWQASKQQDPVAYSSLSPSISPPATSNFPAYSPVFDSNIVEEKRWLEVKKLTPVSTPVEGPCTLNTDRSQLVLKRGYSNTGDTLGESRRVRPKLNGLNISKFKQVDALRNHAASFEEPTTKDPNAFRDISEDARRLFTDIPLLGTENLTFSNYVSKGDTAKDTAGLHGKPSALSAQPFASTSCQADWDNGDSTISYPRSNRDLRETFPIKVEPLDDLVPFEPDMMDLAQKNHDTYTICDDSGSVSKLMFKEDIEAAPSSPMGLQLKNSSRNCRRGTNLQRSTPTTRRSPANGSRRQNNGNTIRSQHGLVDQSNVILAGQGPGLGHTEVKKPVGRPSKARRSRKVTRQVKNTRRILL